MEQQTAYYNVTYAITEASINAGQALRGVLFWRWDAVDNTVRPLVCGCLSCRPSGHAQGAWQLLLMRLLCGLGAGRWAFMLLPLGFRHSIQVRMSVPG